ncbi:PH domain-containing protein [Methanoregula sp.]|jgi:hypothetical protein|uniref:PH domain-containing protein n=1 Tax=Methanoregula sp. TaxID=2052170 RepID=UPI003C2920BE
MSYLTEKYKVILEKEFEKSVNLLPNENIEFKNRGILFRGKLIVQSPGIVVLTNKRIIFFIHSSFGPSEFLYIPLNAISRMNFKTLGFLRSGQRAISLEYDNKSILFSITYVQKYLTSIGGPKETLKFYMLLKEKLPEFIVDETNISIKAWDHYLLLAGLLAGGLIGCFFAGIGGILFSLPSAGFGFLLGKIINKLTK